MSITVVARRAGYPGLETALLAAMVQRMIHATPQGEMMQAAGLFQCITAPTEVLYIAAWASREAHSARVQENRVDELLAPFSSGDCIRYFVRRWASYEIPGAPLGAGVGGARWTVSSSTARLRAESCYTHSYCAKLLPQYALSQASATAASIGI